MELRWQDVVSARVLWRKMTNPANLKVWKNRESARDVVLIATYLLRNKTAKNSVAVAGSRLSMWSGIRIASAWLGAVTLTQTIIRYTTDLCFCPVTELAVTKTA
jgi:hypothetical protein